MNARYTLILNFLVFLFLSSLFAQRPEKTFRQGDWIGQASVGLAGGGLYGDVKVPPINFVVEYAASDEWAVGFFGGYASSEDIQKPFGEEGGEWGYEYSYLILSGSASYHFDVEMENIDVYGRAFLGYIFLSASSIIASQTISAEGNFAAYGSYIGGTYYLTPQFGVQGEAGYGNLALLRFGITLRFDRD